MELDSYFDTEQFKKGLAVRQEVLGEAYVNRSLGNVDPLAKPLQKLVTEWAWGDIWTRPGLERKTRSFLNLAFLTALNRPHEIKIHVRGALNNGLTKEEIVEVFMQAAIYCGVPAALDSFRIAMEVFKEYDAEQASAGAAKND